MVQKTEPKKEEAKAVKKPETTEEAKVEETSQTTKPEPKEIKEVDKVVMLCVSCGKRIESEKFWVEFPCPACGKDEMVRCEKCKSMENTYKCKKCGFIGP